MRCTHYACQCARARELATMSDRTGDPRLMHEAANVGEVECRQPGPGICYCGEYGDDTAYVPPWCYEGGKPPLCSCGHHDRYHFEDGEGSIVCRAEAGCNCVGSSQFPTPEPR